MAYASPTEQEIATALTYIDATDRQTWVSVGTALKTEFGESGFNLFDDWSRQAENYKAADAKSAWKSFRIGKSNIGYVIKQARQNGWQRERQQPMSADAMRERQRQNEEIARQAERERLAEQKAAAEYAVNVWNNADVAHLNHAYLQAKGIDDPAIVANIKQQGDALIIPLKNHGEIVGIQRIFADGSKRFNRGIEKKGSAFILGDRADMKHGFLMAEGFATAATLHIATGKPVVVAFDAGNLKEVAGNLKSFVAKNQTPVWICADVDGNKTGEVKALNAAEVLGQNAQIITPDFSEQEIQNWQQSHDGKSPTDFNDLQAIGGLERVKETLSGSITVKNTVIASINEVNAWQSPDLEREVDTVIASEQSERGNLLTTESELSGNLNNEKLLINIYGAPATGKSYTAQNLTAMLQEQGIDAVYVSEYATDLIRQGQTEKLQNQVAVTTEQARRVENAFANSNLVISDSPVSLGLIYAPENQKAEVSKIIENSHTSPVLNIFLQHNTESLASYAMGGRIHDKNESLAIQSRLETMLADTPKIHSERGVTMEDLINTINQTTEWQTFAKTNGVELSGRLNNPTVIASINEVNAWQSLDLEREADTVIASEQSERGNLLTTESELSGSLNNQEIATTATQSRNDGVFSGRLNVVENAINQSQVSDIMEDNFEKDSNDDNRTNRTNSQTTTSEISIPTNADRAGISGNGSRFSSSSTANERVFKELPTLSTNESTSKRIESTGTVMPRPERSAWGDFPPLVRNGSLEEMKSHPDYIAAKSGDFSAAIKMVSELMKPETLQQINQMVGDKKPIVIAVQAEESAGRNKIPAALATTISEYTGWEQDNKIFQADHVGRTGTDSSFRLAFNPTFRGEVEQGRDYLIIDDNSTMGGTIASLKGYIENRGGHVLGAVVLSAREGRLNIVPTQKQFNHIQQKFGNEPNQYWEQEFGYGIDKLTRSEAGVIRTSPTFELIKERIEYARETVRALKQNSEISTDPETPRPPQGGFVLPVENENRQPENPKKDNPMAENQPLDETIPNPATANAMSNADIQAMVQQNQADIAKAEEMMQNNNIQNRQTEQPLNSEQRRAMAAENSLYAQANSDRETLLQHNEVLQKHTLTPAEPLQTEHFQPDEFVPDEWQPETNSIDFADDRQIVIDEVEKPEQPEMTNQEKVQAAFETLQNQYNGYRYNPETQRLEIENSKTSEEIHYQQDTEKLVYTAVDNGERQTIGDIEIKDLSPEYLALSVENRRLAYNQALLQGAFPNAEKRQQLDAQGDQLDESIRQAKRKTETLSPPVAPPPPLDQRYNAVERKFMDNTTHYGDSTNLGIKKRVDYVDVQNGKTVMFSDKGNKLTTSRNPDAQTVQDMAKVAIAKGWDSVKLRGNKDFKRMAWLELESQGIKTKGYSPSPQDKAMLEKLREQRSLSGMENVSENRQAENQNPTVIASEQSERGNLPTTESETPTIGNLNDKEIATPATQVRNDGLNSGSLNNKTKQPEKILSQEAKDFFDELHNNPTAEKGGILLAHGSEHYQFNPSQAQSYFATIQYPDGEKTYWGKDIERVFQENHIDSGDRIDLQKTEKVENVRVQEIVRDEQGEPVLDENGQPKYEEVMRQRNVWEVNVYAKANEVSGSLNNNRHIEPTGETAVQNAKTENKQGFDLLQQDYLKAKATLSPKQQEYLSVSERLIHHSFEKEHISQHTREYYLGNFYRNTTAEIKNGTIDIPSPYAKSKTVSKSRNISKPKTQTKGVDI